MADLSLEQLIERATTILQTLLELRDAELKPVTTTARRAAEMQEKSFVKLRSRVTVAEPAIVGAAARIAMAARSLVDVTITRLRGRSGRSSSTRDADAVDGEWRVHAGGRQFLAL